MNVKGELNSFDSKNESGNTSKNTSHDCHVHFSIDRSCIPTVPKNDQNAELYNLGIEIYEQSVLGKEILYQVNEVLEKQNQKKNEKEILNIGSNGDTEVSDSNAETVINNDNSVLGINVTDCIEENDMGRKIRMGEMTPFGTCVPFNSTEVNCFSNVERYLKNQIETEKRKKLEKLNIVSVKKDEVKRRKKLKLHDFSLKNNNFSQKKRKNKEHLGTITREEISDSIRKPEKRLSEKSAITESSGSEYFPSECDISSNDEIVKDIEYKSKRKIQLKAKHKDYENEDSDWEYSDNEKSPPKKSKIAKKEPDDGDINLYLKRLSVWEKHNDREKNETQVRALSDGFKIPLIIWNKLFNYQKVGVQWLWELNVQRCGGILGDEMGLGKTIQVIAFLSGLSISGIISRHGSFEGLGPVLIICPTTVMHQWVKELHDWWPQFRVAIMHESGTFNGKRSNLLEEIVKKRGILVTSYVNCVQHISILTRYIWHYVILDEGHKIRNPDAQITNAVKQLKTPHRIIISGSPMQNNLKELWSLFDFIFPGKLGTLPVFMSEFGVPITQGGYTNASQVQVATAYKCATVLRDTISPYLLRRVKEDVKNHINLPMKNEQVLFCKLTDEQKTLYEEYLKSNEVDEILSGKYKIFVGLINLRKICNHPHLYSGGPKLFKWDKAESVLQEERYGYWKKAGKMIVVETLLKIWKKQDHRVLIFTQSKQMLHILENFVQLQGYEYLKLDGSTDISGRQPLINQFNKDRKYFLFLSTTHVGGLGINLTGADRVIIYDPDWNPATDMQARERTWRIGQTNQVTIYRLITSGTIEEKIYHRQIFKQFLTNKVLKDPRQRRFFKSNDLYELFTLKDTSNDITETSAIFAGSGSEVNLKNLAQREKLRKIKSNELEKKIKAADILSREKIERMKKLAKFLSQKISENINKTDEGNSHFASVGPPVNDENHSKINMSCENNKSNQKKKKMSNAFCKKKEKVSFDTFEGELVPHLLNKMEYSEFLNSQNNCREEQDDYILKKLFSKSEIQTALQHDKIIESGPADYALVEGEAEKVAKEAVRALKKSRRYYFESLENSKSILKPRFGLKSRSKIIKNNYNSNEKNNYNSNEKNNYSSNAEMSSSELLSRIRERNRLLMDNDTDVSSDHMKENINLLTDIRNFVAFETNICNVATTQEIVNKFQDRLPAGTSPLFKALLLEICEFSRNSDGQGVWRLRTEFRWL